MKNHYLIAFTDSLFIECYAAHYPEWQFKHKLDKNFPLQ